MGWKNWRRVAWPASLVFLADQSSKLFFEIRWPVGELVPGFLGFRPLYNPGFFFGLWRFAHLRPLTLLVSLLVVFLTVSLRRQALEHNAGGRRLDFALGLVWGGMLGNLADRLLLGKVFDFIHLWPIPVFNLADAALTAGAVLLALDCLPLMRKPCPHGRPG